MVFRSFEFFVLYSFCARGIEPEFSDETELNRQFFLGAEHHVTFDEVWTLSASTSISRSTRIVLDMGWQKTFTLSKRAKGCHLVTEEIINHIRPGLQDVQASLFPWFRWPNDRTNQLSASLTRIFRSVCFSFSCKRRFAAEQQMRVGEEVDPLLIRW